MEADVKEIIKRLEKIEASGSRSDDIFEDWLMLVETCLERLPAHMVMARRCGEMADDTPEGAALFERLRKKYGRYGREEYYFTLFAEAMGLLMDSTALGYRDVVGDVYMAYAYPHPGAGQYFTPFPVASMMAKMTIPDGEREVHDRLKEAIAQSPMAEAAAIAGMAFCDPSASFLKASPSDEAWNWFFNYLLPAAIPYYKPITVSDPAVGSGVMLLASASCFPTWAVQLGLVQFYGQDVDGTCVRMCHINEMLYGLNGWGLRYALAAYGVSDETLMGMEQGALLVEDAVRGTNGTFKQLKMDLVDHYLPVGVLQEA